MRSSLAPGSLSLLALLACSSPDDPPAGAAGAAGTAGAAGSQGVCAKDNRAQSYSPGMELPGKAGLYSVRLESISPVPAFKGDNLWKVQIVDASKQPVDGLTLKVKPFMPDHGHGSSITPQIKPQGAGGRYDVEQLNLFMPGLWQVFFTVQPAAGGGDEAEVAFCVEG